MRQLDIATVSADVTSRRGRLYSTRDGWTTKGPVALAGADHSVPKPAQRRPYLADRDVDYSVSGLGAYRSYRRYPGKHFPNRGLTVSTTAGETRKAAGKARIVHDSL